MEEQQIDAVPLLTNPQPSLSSDESEVAAKLQQKIFQLLDEGVFQIVLGVLVLQIKELQHIGVFDLFFGRHQITRLRFRSLLDHGSFVLGEQRPLVEFAADLPI